MWRRLGLAAVLGSFVLAGCGSRPPVPVGERKAPVVVEPGVAGKAPAQAQQPSQPVAAAPAVPREGHYIVKKGDTLRRIAQEHGLDYRQLAAWNNLTDPNRLEVGQELRILPPEGVAIAQPIAMPAPVTVVSEGGPAAQPPPAAPALSAPGSDALKRDPRGGKLPYSETALAEVKAMEGGARPAAPRQPEKAAEKPAEKPAQASAAVASEGIEWTWPAAGKVISEFVEKSPGKERIKGIEISGRMGEPIQAAAAGTVAFVGALPSYGDFVILHHAGGFMSVYAHTSKILVKKDQPVAKGQKIAEVGSSGSDQAQLGFEIRQQGKPVDPLKLLPARQ